MIFKDRMEIQPETPQDLAFLQQRIGLKDAGAVARAVLLIEGREDIEGCDPEDVILFIGRKG